MKQVLSSVWLPEWVRWAHLACWDYLLWSWVGKKLLGVNVQKMFINFGQCQQWSNWKQLKTVKIKKTWTTVSGFLCYKNSWLQIVLNKAKSFCYTISPFWLNLFVQYGYFFSVCFCFCFFSFLWTSTMSQSIKRLKRTWLISSHFDLMLGQWHVYYGNDCSWPPSFLL